MAKLIFIFCDTMEIDIISSKELIKEIGGDFKRDIEEIDLEVYEKGYKKMKEKELERLGMIYALLHNKTKV
jgi:hypothetical protein